MPQTTIVFFRDSRGKVPVLEWLDYLATRDRKAWTNCLARIEQLSSLVHELRRPAADYLRDDIRELRAKHGHVQYWILYFFHGRQVAILAHAIVKEGARVPDADIEKALDRKRAFEANPQAHSNIEG